MTWIVRLGLYLAATAPLLAQWNPSEEVTSENGDPASAQIADFGTPRVVLGSDGGAAVILPPCHKSESGVRWEKPVAEGQDFVLPVQRVAETDTPGWKAVTIGLENGAGERIGVVLRAEFFIAAKLRPTFQSLTQKKGLTYPCEVRLRVEEGRVSVSVEGQLAYEFEQNAQDPFTTPFVLVSRQGPKDGVLAEIGPGVTGTAAALPPVVAAATAPEPEVPSPPGEPVATASTFPKVIMGTPMFWCMPGSTRFLQGELTPKHGGTTASGFYGDAPLVRDMTQELHDMKKAGIEVLVLDFFTHMDVTGVLERYLDLAAESGTGVQVMGMLEQPHTKQQWPADILKQVWEARTKDGKPLREHPNLFTPGEGHVPVYITFGTEPAAVWRQRLNEVRRAGGNATVIGDTISLEIAVTTKVPERFAEAIAPLAGAYFFHSHTSALRDDGKGIMPDFKRFIDSFGTDKIFGVSVTPSYVSSMRSGNLLSPRGTEVLRRQWMDVIANDPDFVHLSVLSDYTENTQMECSSNASFSFLDMTKYFGERWRTGQWPQLDKPQAFLSYKKTLSPGQKASFELVVLDPALTGQETAEELKARYAAELAVDLYDGQIKSVPQTSAQAFPGHAVLEFAAAETWDGGEFALPRMPHIRRGETDLGFADTHLAPIAIVGDGEEASRHWFTVPLHRVRDAGKAALAVQAAEGEAYPRDLKLDGVDWDAVDCVVFERSPNPLSSALPAEVAKESWPEPYYVGRGFSPIAYGAGWSKRWVADQTDRYLSVIRYKDDTVAFPRPALMAAPRQQDRTVVQDPVIAPTNGSEKEELADRGPLQRPLPLGPEKDASRPAIVPVKGAAAPWWALQFDGANDRIRQGPFTFPPVNATVELWVKPEKDGRRQAMLYSQAACFNLAMKPNGTVVLERANENRKVVPVNGKQPLRIGQWNHLAAVYEGDMLKLYVNGKPDGEVFCPGARTDEFTLLGGTKAPPKDKGPRTKKRAVGDDVRQTLGWAPEDDAQAFAGEIARFRVLGRAATPEEVAQMARRMQAVLGAPTVTASVDKSGQ